MQAHLSAHPGLGSGQEVCRAHPCFDGAEWMLNRLPAYSHRLGCPFQPLLHGLQYRLMLPSCHAPLWTWRACGFERALLATRAPIAMQIQPFLFTRKAPYQALSGGTLIFVGACVVNEVCFAKPTFSRGIGGQVLGHDHIDAGLCARQDFFAFEVTTISNDCQRCSANRVSRLPAH